MGLKLYLPIAVMVFAAATAGADVVARTSLGQPLVAAFREHLYWAGAELVGTLLLLAPFVAVAGICALAERKARTRSVLVIFALAMLALLYVYFQGYQAAKRAELEHLWTAAALSIGFLPLGIGLAVVSAVTVFGWLATQFDPRAFDPGR
jgi:heme/copper-type cytochrome/quinol oxidase subunit 3